MYMHIYIYVMPCMEVCGGILSFEWIRSSKEIILITDRRRLNAALLCICFRST